ncbi:hypothetical protein, partial [Escherichia coli]|uniref:hypothetical protein n=1 Tax=Escherichia coli TaxID=562 RepID=UPI001F2F0041
MYKAQIEQMGGLAQMADQERDPARRQQLWGQIVSSHPEFAATMAKHGQNPNDHVDGPRFLLAQVKGYQDEDSV